MKEEYEFDSDEFRSGKKLTGKGRLIKQLKEDALEAEVKSHIAMMCFQEERTDVIVPIKKLSKVPVMEPLNLKPQEIIIAPADEHSNSMKAKEL